MQVLQPPNDESLGFGLFRVRSPLLAESLIVFFSSRYLDVSVPWVTVFRRPLFKWPGFPIRTSMDQRLFAPLHGFSQLITSFVVSESLGIPRTPLFASYSLPNRRIFKRSYSLLFIPPSLSMNFSKWYVDYLSDRTWLC